MSAAAQTDPRPMSGRDLRRLTREATEAHGGGAIGDAIGEIYTVVFSVLVSLAVAVGVVQMLNTSIRPGTTDVTLDSSWLAVIIALIVIGAAVSVAGRFGPLGVGGGQAAWWLPMPVDRRGLVRPRLGTVTAISFGVGAVVGLVVGIFAGEQGVGTVWTAAVGGVAGAFAVLLVARGQVSGLGRSVHPAVPIGEALMGAGPAVALAVVLVRPDSLAPPQAHLLGIVAGVLLVAAVALLVDTDRRLDAISGAELRARGAVTAYAAGAAQSLDTRELGRALSITAQPDARRRSSAFGWVRGPIGALVSGDALLTLRSRRQVIGIVVSILVPVIVSLSGWASWTMALAFLAAGYACALATAEGARRAEMSPALDRAFAIEAAHVRRIRLIWPGVVLAVWAAVAIGTWAYLSGLPVTEWLPLAAVAGPTLAAGAVRGAYRKATDWSKPLIHNPMGPPFPPGLISTFSRGPDIVIICLIPTILGIVAVAASPVRLFPWQLATTLIALAIAAHVPDPKGPFAQAMAGQGASKARR